jgi:Skp family chaperone for outer membrane proteins
MPVGCRIAALAVAATMLCLPVAGRAQGPVDPLVGIVSSPILMIDEERLFADSRYGRAVLADIDAEQQALVAENRTLEAELADEERVLTDQRESLAPEAFRALADAFDARVTETRRRQDAKSRALLLRRDSERQRVIEAAIPVLSDIMRDAGAVAILRDEAVLLSFERIDITDIAIARLDALLPTDSTDGDAE